MAAGTSPPKTKDYSRFSEIAAVALVAAAVLVFLCLVTYSPNDWSFNTVSSQKTQNWIGVAGAVASDLLFQTVGFAAYLLPALLGIAAWRLFRLDRSKISKRRAFGYLALLVSVASLSQMFGNYGGITGAFFERMLASLVGKIGTGILLSAAALTSLLMITNFSIFSLFSDFELAWQNFQIRFEDYFVGYRKWREARNKAALERLEKRRQIREGLNDPESPVIATPESAAGEAPKIEKGFGEKSSDAKGRTVIANADDETVPESAEKAAEVSEIPTISASEDGKGISPESDIISSAPFDLVAESEKIPISPVKVTGDLDAGLVEIADEQEAEPKRKNRSQSFGDYVLPETEFLTPQPPRFEQKDEELLAIAQELSEKTKEFNVTGRVMHICQGPVVTTYEFKPDPGVKYSRVTGLVDDLCLALKAESIRIERIPGKAFVGIEVPNSKRETIFLREVIESKKFKSSKSLLTLALGKTIDGLNYVSDLAKMPHLLIAGATGAGKSVGVNPMK